MESKGNQVSPSLIFPLIPTLNFSLKAEQFSSMLVFIFDFSAVVPSMILSTSTKLPDKGEEDFNTKSMPTCLEIISKKMMYPFYRVHIPTIREEKVQMSWTKLYYVPDPTSTQRIFVIFGSSSIWNWDTINKLAHLFRADIKDNWTAGEETTGKEMAPCIHLYLHHKSGKTLFVEDKL